MPDEFLSFADVFTRLEAGPTLDAGVVREAFAAILGGAWTPVQIGAFAAVLRLRGETPDTLVAAAQALRREMTPVEHDLENVLDTCGTGGDGAHTLNVSTAAAIVVAACGVHVAKHGNRSVSSRCGSADVVAALGVPLDVPPARQHEVLRDAHLAFLYAPTHHAALRHAAQARRELGIRTLFNAVGPLANPARATHQLIGVYDDALRSTMAAALRELGVRHAWVVRSEDGLDEISPAAPTRVSVLADGCVTERVVQPSDFGLGLATLSSIDGSDAASNAAAIVRLLDGGTHPALTAVLMNAAAALSLVRGGTLREATAECRDALVSRRGRETLETWRNVARRTRDTA
jgi:anthranilate phosphoribosyltransferase